MLRGSFISLYLALSVGVVACGPPGLVKGPTCAEAFPAVAEWAARQDRKSDVYFIECDDEIRGRSLERVKREDAAAACDATGCFRLILRRANGRLEEFHIVGQSAKARLVPSALHVYRVSWARAWTRWAISQLDLIGRS